MLPLNKFNMKNNITTHLLESNLEKKINRVKHVVRKTKCHNKRLIILQNNG